uniref:50S ribosomal protein L4 n=1 Tax=uncultured Nitrospirae bacterium Rifle_16ft_4_minimus_4901 TaxID=1665132 RepID=A0A0H4T8V4_9BACT|nr:hypothetical protein [uncultured Nitrospirae bacterium Rifle_16ft_4_minimus_4901]
MLEVSVVDINKKKVGSVQLDDRIFGQSVNMPLTIRGKVHTVPKQRALSEVEERNRTSRKAQGGQGLVL